ncbi:phosphoribosylglycinamide formyltransferase [Nesterenkonia lutea]|uniref:Phosphoribosylglycinamide formyltransferase n=1 Tax=Nesterenkonia lutea TaxID=272919 RepID=A0ABR9JAV9_9MICC|nr:phosphoribosylglycinamide formyltransferase [Nesterenkonia lutea]MBE1522943.1 phosphoribosylglycinamide formyltransferase-1 [Nesterenkonia lutea]
MRIVVLVSGSGTNLQAVIDAVQAGTLDLEIAAVGSDIPGCGGVRRAQDAGIPTFEVPLVKGGDRAEWNRALCAAVQVHAPDLVVSSGFMRILGAEFLEGVAAPIINTHPALLPSFPGAHAVRDALAHGVRITGCTVHRVDAGVDTGPIIAQEAVPVLEADDQDSLHVRIKVAERRLLVQTLRSIAAGGLSLG